MNPYHSSVKMLFHQQGIGSFFRWSEFQRWWIANRFLTINRLTKQDPIPKVSRLVFGLNNRLEMGSNTGFEWYWGWPCIGGLASYNQAYQPTEEYPLSEYQLIQQTAFPNTIPSLVQDFAVLGLQAGDTVIVHSSLRQVGWTVGGPVAVIKALMQVLTPLGTLVMPTHTSANSDPANWQNPPVPPAWWQVIRDHMPAFNPDLTPTAGMGVTPELFRCWPDVRRSNHPQTSFAAWGRHADFITANHQLEEGLGEGSPLARIYDVDGKVLLLGVTHDSNTSLHLAEYRAVYPSKAPEACSGAVWVNGERQWLTWNDLTISTEDFEQIGAAYESHINYTPGKVGAATTRLFSQRSLVDFATDWMSHHRP